MQLRRLLLGCPVEVHISVWGRLRPSFDLRTALRTIIGVLLASVACHEVQGQQAAVERRDESLCLRNKLVELWLELGDGRCAASRLVNKPADRTIPIRSDDFAIGIEGRAPLRAADFVFKEARDDALDAGRRLTLRFEGKTPGLRLDVVYELGNDDFFLRRRLELSTTEPLPLRQVDVWLVGVEGPCSHQGFGEPVLLDDTFWGLEYPAGHNGLADGVVTLSQFPGRTVPDRFVTKTAVVGVAESGRIEQRFRQYVQTFQVTPKEARLFVNYNTWWTLMPPTEQNCLALVELFKRKLYDPYGEFIDTFTVDDGWDKDDSLWDFSDAFPHGFAPLIEALKPMKANLGVWISPSSRYGHAPWGAAHAYELNSDGFDLCQSGPKYRRDMVNRVTDLARQYNPAFIKFDGFGAGCETQGHGHLAGPYAVEANVDAYIELINAVRDARPGIYLDLTCGIWLSPWWLKYGDSLWGEVSGDYPDVIVPAPILRDSATTTRDGVFRQRCREHPGFPPAAIEHLGIIVITPEKWEDNAMMVLGRGSRLLTLYINPECFRNGERDWAFLASILKWARHNAATLQNTELVLGDPFKREVHGYAHFDGARGIIALRNPSIEPQTATVKLDESAGWSRPGALGPSGNEGARVPTRFVARIVYPREETLGGVPHYGDTLEMSLQAFETVILHLDPVKADEPVLVGARHHETGRSGKRVTFDVHGRPGQTIAPLIVSRHPPSRALLDGKEVALQRTANGLRLALAFPGEDAACRVEGGQLAATTSETTWQIGGNCVVNVPAGAQASIYVLCEPREAFKERFACAARVNGKPVEVRAVESPNPGQWTWFQFDLPEGRSEVALEVKPASGGGLFRGDVGCWLWTEHSLRKSTLTLEFDEPLPVAPSEPRPLPINMESERRIITIQPPKHFDVGRSWPEPVKLEGLDRATVYLDEVVPDEASQEWGTLQRRQSVWEREMTIAGQKFSRGLGTHANGKLVFRLPEGRFKRFACLIGHDEATLTGTVAFEVWVDGKKAFDSGPMDRTAAAKPVEVDVSGAKVLELRTLDAGDGITCDHADWADARLER